MRRSFIPYLLLVTAFFLLSCDPADTAAPVAVRQNPNPNQSAPSAASANLHSQAGLMVLGVAQDAGYPQINCRKACCVPAWNSPVRRRMVSCLGLVDPATGQRWLFDATPNLKQQLHLLEQQAGWREGPVVDGIFLTHAHIGHYTGLMDLGREAMGASAVPVFAMPRMRTFLRTNGPWNQLVKLNNIDLRPMAADSAIVLNGRISVTPLLVPHRDEYSETVGFLIDGPEKKALFIPDIDKWHKWEQDLPRLVSQVDYAFLDGTFYADGELPGRDMSEIPHPFIAESMALLEPLPPAERAKVIFIHFNHTNPVLDPEGEALKAVEAAGYRIARQGTTFPM